MNIERRKAADGDERGRITTTWGEETPPSIAIIEAIAAAEGVDPVELHVENNLTLHDHIDPDALDALLERQPATDLVVSFALEDRPVTVYASGEIVIGAPDSDASRNAHARRRPLAATIETAFDVQRTANEQRQQLAHQTLSLQQSVITQTQQLARQTLSLQRRARRLALVGVRE